MMQRFGTAARQLFEQSAQLFLDAVVLDLMQDFNIDETAMQENHANLE